MASSDTPQSQTPDGVGTTFTQTVTVQEADTVGAVLPGMPPVAATPYLVKIAEVACFRMVEGLLQPGQITVGSRVVIDHLGPSKVGAALVVEATLREREKNRFRFSVRIQDGERTVANVEHERAAVSLQKIMGAIGSTMTALEGGGKGGLPCARSPSCCAGAPTAIPTWRPCSTKADANLRRLDASSSALAAALIIQLGLEPGDRVAILDKNCAAYLELLFALDKAGIVAAPLNWRLTPHEVRLIIDDIKPKLIVTGPEFKQHGISAGVRTLNFDELPRGGMDPHRDVDGAVAWQFSTSGTTGLPKGAMLTGWNVLNTGLCLALEMPEIREGGPSLVCMPMFHLGGAGWAIWSMQEGATLVIVREIVPEALLKTIVEQKIETALLVPSVMLFLTELPAARTRRLLPLQAHHLRHGADLARPAQALHRHLQVQVHADLRADRDRRAVHGAHLRASCRRAAAVVRPADVRRPRARRGSRRQRHAASARLARSSTRART